MRCEKCKQYVPEGLGVNICPNCGSEVKEVEKHKISESENLDNTEKNKQTSILIDSQPEYKKIKLNKEQVLKIENRLSKEFKTILIAGIIVLVIFIGAFIPIGFFPKSHRYRDLDRNSSLIESMGVIPTIIFLTLFCSIIIIVGLRKNIFFKLRKDLKDLRIYTFETRIISINEFDGDSGIQYDIFIEKNDAKIDKLNYLKSEFPDLTKGDIIQVSITQNAHFVVKTEKQSIRKKYNP